MDGKKIIAPKQPEAGIIRWVFHQLAKNIHKIEGIRRMADDKGLKCSRSYFSKLIRNPAYCGLISIKLSSGEQYMVKGIHDPLISEALFHEVQRIITTKRKTSCKREDLKAMFFLTGFLICPLCNRKLCGSFSTGSTKRHPYYHCRGRCKTRIKAPLLNERYQQELQELMLSSKAVHIFNCVLEDWNTNNQKAEYIQERKQVVRKLIEQESILSQARKLFVAAVLKLDDYSELKREYHVNSKCLKRELSDINEKLKNIEKQCQQENQPIVNILQGFLGMDTTDKKYVVNLIPPLMVDYQTGDMSLNLSTELSKILLIKNTN
ncbi:recombinase family protein [Sphingobacterium mizutaii]|nr:recombinase family protein [Sphingobacterium mizutaii]